MEKLQICLNLLSRTGRIIVPMMLVSGMAVLAILYARGYRLRSSMSGDAFMVAPSGMPAAILPQLGYVLDMLAQPVGLAVLVILPALVILVFEVRRLVKAWSC